jgi:hypothetical protein
MISRDDYLAIEWILGYITLLLGCLGQAGFLGLVIRPYIPVWVAAPIILMPYVIVYTITFFQQPFLPPRAFRLCIGLSMCWLATLTIIAELLHLRGHMPPDSPAYAGTLARILMHVGWFSLVPLVRTYVVTYRYERETEKGLVSQ